MHHAPCPQVERAQQTVLEVLSGVEGRGKGGMSPEQQARFDQAVAILEADGGVQVGWPAARLVWGWRAWGC